MAKVDEAIEELTDEISAVNTKYEGLAKDVSDIKKSMAQMAEAANKPIPPPTVSQSVVSQVVSVALGEYFRLHPCRINVWSCKWQCSLRKIPCH